MMATVHILNGDSTAYILEKSQLKGDTIVWREMLCNGPLEYDIGSDTFWMKRYEFFKNELKVDKLEYYDKTISELVKIEDLSTYDEVVMWFEYDLFCQINLMALCTYLLKHFRKDISYYLICVGREYDKNGWQTLGDYLPEEYHELYKKKVKISRHDLLFAKDCWNIYVESDQEQMKHFDFNKNKKFQYFEIAIEQDLKNRSQSNGLDQIDHKILQVLAKRPSSKFDVIKELLSWQKEETVNGFGDLQYELRLKNLKAFYEVNDNLYQLNKKGIEAIT